MNASFDVQMQDPPEGDVLAAEYVLGVLDADQRRIAMQRVQTDLQFAGEVAAWERHFSPWLQSIAPMAVADHIWPRIQQTLGLLGPMRADRTTTPPASASWWDSVGVWRWLSAGGFTAAAASLFAMMINTQRPQSAPTPAPPIATVPVPAPAMAVPDMVATMAADDGGTAFVANIDSQHGKIMMVPVSVDSIPAGVVPELWLIPEGGAALSLGLLDPTRAHSVDIPESMRDAMSATSLLAVTLEPPGGAPGGKATGPIIAKGGIFRI
ncbi:MAG: anti-sigma factor [Lysobacter sp.]|nr:anti-sigma factor [Lysobacter sp.]